MTAYLIGELDIRGGTHKQFLKLLEYSAAHGVDFKVITQRVDWAETYPGFAAFRDRIAVIGEVTRRNFFRKGLQLRRELKGIRVVNIHGSGFERLFPFLWDRKVVWQINDLPGVFCEGIDREAVVSRRAAFSAWWIKFFTVHFIDLITVNVSKNAQRVQKHLGMAARVLYCGIDPVNILRDNGQSFARFEQKKLRLLSSGVFFPYRNYETLVLTVELLCRKGIDAELNIFGSWQLGLDYYQRVKALVESKKLEDRVHILGQVDEQKYRELHETSDIFCFVNVDQSWGLAVFEAMSAGLPVVVSRSVGATEILTDGENACFVDPLDALQIADRLEELMTDREFYLKLQRNGRKIPEEYTWEKAYCAPMLEILAGLGK